MSKQKDKPEIFNHGVLLYQNPNHKRKVIFNCLKETLSQERGILYIAGDEPPAKIYQEMFDFGFNVKNLQKEGMLKVVNFDEWYLINGKFDLKNVKALLTKTYNENLEKGIKGLFICGEMGCFFQHNLINDLLKYEKSIGKTFKISINAVCAYDINNIIQLEAKLFFDLIRSHNQVFSPSFSGLFDFEDFYFQILSQKLETVVGSVFAKKLLSFLSKWRPLLEAELEDGTEDLHTALESFIGSQARQIEEKTWLKITEKFGLV